ncbi:MAG: hypothetical protein KGL39_42015 [Patescibacteria group bacterium]|nr:hypothetical protein [Patescibacteria group bacterium]
MSSDLSEMSTLLTELDAGGVSVDDAIATTERRLKMLRSIRSTISSASKTKEAKPRGRKKAEGAA